MKIAGIIPARYASTRFPGKPLVDIAGKTMIHRVYEQALKAKSLTEVLVATDDERIFKEVEGFGGKVIMTAPHHQNGTERCAEVAAKLDVNVVINIQGDEPFIQPEQIDLLSATFINNLYNTQIATLIKVHPFHALDEVLNNPARIKVVVNNKLEALYFSRSLIPFLRDHSKALSTTFYKHIGIYGFRKDVLLELVKLPPSHLELAESLEQLRWLENGYRIQCAITNMESTSVDVPADLEGLSFPV
jgi:3-deoxy-manno-octulosonate cytidylyltransferase (CMP-KDO synthetase)